MKTVSLPTRPAVCKFHFSNIGLRRTKLVGVAYKLRKKMKNSPPCVHVLHKTLNVVISRCCFAGDDKEMYQNVNARAERLFLLILNLLFCGVVVAVAVV